jgi:hypothetical protein
MSLQNIDLERDGNNDVLRGRALWDAGESTKTDKPPANAMLNARVVEFIAKPGKVELLEEYVRGPILEFLNRQKGFAGALILNSHQEQRLILVVSLWTTRKLSEETCWEKSRVVRQTAGFLIDVCSRVQTYQAGFAKSSSIEHEIASGWKLGAEVQE